MTTNKRVFKSRLAIGLVCFILLTPTLSFGWGAGGHMMVAQIAYGRLNKKAQAQVRMLLTIPIEPVVITRQSPDFINASHWADDLRPFREFDFLKPLHFIDQPFSVDGTALPAGVPEPDNIVKALEDNVKILKTSMDTKEQARALRLIIHFVGDIHQPLHCATRVDYEHPEGDLGGNQVKLKVSGKSVALHSYWDGGINSFPQTGANFAPPPLAQIGPAAARAMAANPVTNKALKLDDPFNFKLWANESFTLAKDVAYRGIKNNTQPTAAYNKNAIKVVQTRVAWGGYRLSALLNSIWPE